jgi:hypothetical protein
MTTNTRPLGIMRPLGGGDPIPLKKAELILGRRPTCDIKLDFENISGKHCQLRHINGVWHVRDLNSTNGTTVNGQRISSQHGLMPDDELGLAGHYFQIDYDPIAPTSLLDANQILEEEIAEAPRHRSLMELAGLERNADDFAFPQFSPRATAAGRPRPSSDLPEHTLPAASRPKVVKDDEDQAARKAVRDEPPATPFTDDDFFEMIREDVEDES